MLTQKELNEARKKLLISLVAMVVIVVGSLIILADNGAFSGFTPQGVCWIGTTEFKVWGLVNQTYEVKTYRITYNSESMYVMQTASFEMSPTSASYCIPDPSPEDGNGYSLEQDSLGVYRLSKHEGGVELGLADFIDMWPSGNFVVTIEGSQLHIWSLQFDLPPITRGI